MDREWESVQEFQRRFGHPYREMPQLIDVERAKARYQWMLEEMDEFLEAEDLVEQADAMIDLIYFALGTLVEMGVKPDPLFDIVHQANMSKLWPDGKPHYAPDGKTVKPAGWEDPHAKLEEAIRTQAEREGGET